MAVFRRAYVHNYLPILKMPGKKSLNLVQESHFVATRKLVNCHKTRTHRCGVDTQLFLWDVLLVVLQRVFLLLEQQVQMLFDHSKHNPLDVRFHNDLLCQNQSAFFPDVLVARLVFSWDD